MDNLEVQSTNISNIVNELKLDQSNFQNKISILTNQIQNLVLFVQCIKNGLVLDCDINSKETILNNNLNNETAFVNNETAYNNNQDLNQDENQINDNLSNIQNMSKIISKISTNSDSYILNTSKITKISNNNKIPESNMLQSINNNSNEQIDIESNIIQNFDIVHKKEDENVTNNKDEVNKQPKPNERMKRIKNKKDLNKNSNNSSKSIINKINNTINKKDNKNNEKVDLKTFINNLEDLDLDPTKFRQIQKYYDSHDFKNVQRFKQERENQNIAHKVHGDQNIEINLNILKFQFKYYKILDLDSDKLFEKISQFAEQYKIQN